MINWDDINSEKFIKRLKSDDETAFAELYPIVIRALVPFLIKQFENSGITSSDTEEIANDTMLKVSKAIFGFDSKRGAKLTTWIFEIATNQTKDFLRSRKSGKSQAISAYLQREKELKVETERLQIKDVHTELSNLTSVLETGKNYISEETIIARKAFDSLKESDQDIIRMRRVMEYEDIAKVENKTINSLRTQHTRAMEKLKNLQNVYQEEHQNEQ